MTLRRAITALFFAAGLAAASDARAQFATFSRCHAAFPCSEPFGLQYRPDPVLAGSWTDGSPSSAVSAAVELKQRPELRVDQRPQPAVDDPVEASVRAFLRRHPAPEPARPVPEKKLELPPFQVPDPKR